MRGREERVQREEGRGKTEEKHGRRGPCAFTSRNSINLFWERNRMEREVKTRSQTVKAMAALIRFLGGVNARAYKRQSKDISLQSSISLSSSSWIISLSSALSLNPYLQNCQSSYPTWTLYVHISPSLFLRLSLSTSWIIHGIHPYHQRLPISLASSFSIFRVRTAACHNLPTSP